jgi:hypothetical protein
MFPGKHGLDLAKQWTKEGVGHPLDNGSQRRSFSRRPLPKLLNYDPTSRCQEMRRT